jgi:hypothetical protein
MPLYFKNSHPDLRTVILSEAKDLLSCAVEESRSFASLRMTVLQNYKLSG